MNDEAQSKRMAIADQILRIAHDVDFGASPEFTARELRKLAQIVQPGCAATPANPNDSARWIVNDERLTALERELQERRSSLKKQSDAFAFLARSCEVKWCGCSVSWVVAAGGGLAVPGNLIRAIRDSKSVSCI